MNKWYTTIPYTLTQAPAAIRRAKLDNIALVPASLLPFKVQYISVANRFPIGSVLCVPGTPRQQKIMAMVTQFFRNHGHQAITVPLEKITRNK